MFLLEANVSIGMLAVLPEVVDALSLTTTLADNPFDTILPTDLLARIVNTVSSGARLPGAVLDDFASRFVQRGFNFRYCSWRFLAVIEEFHLMCANGRLSLITVMQIR